MKAYKRLTVKNAMLSGRTDGKWIYNRLYKLENAIENGTLVELPCKVGDTVWRAEENDEGRLIYGEVVSIAYKWIPDIKQENRVILQTYFKASSPEVFHRVGMFETAIYGFFFELVEIGKSVFLTEAEAREKLNSLNDEFAECRDCPAWSGSDCTRHPYNEGCLKEVNKEKNDNDL
nr:MAG TPA: hypothetical protein [Caudoviricetes sp.]